MTGKIYQSTRENSSWSLYERTTKSTTREQGLCVPVQVGWTVKKLFLKLLSRFLNEGDVQWVVNDIAELGVSIGSKQFFLYKGQSYVGGRKYRRVGKREFGETQHPNLFYRDGGRDRWYKEAGLHSGIDSQDIYFEWKPISGGDK